MSRPPSLRRNFAFTLLGNFLYGGAQWGMLVVLAKLGSPELVGRFALALAVTAPVVMFASLRLRSALSTDAAGRYEFGDYLGLLLITMLGAYLVIAGLAAGMAWNGSGEVFLVVMIIGLAKVFEQVSELFNGLMQKHERMDLVARSLSLKGLASLVCFSGAMLVTRDLAWGAAFMAAAWAGSLFGFDARNARSGLGLDAAVLRPRFSPEKLKSLARLAMPLGFASLLTSLFVNVPRYFVGSMLGERDLGIFAAMAYVGIVGMRVINSLGLTVIPRLAKQHAGGDARGYRRLALRTAGVGLTLGVAGVLVAAAGGRPLLTALYGPVYAERLDVFIWLMSASAVEYVGSFLDYALVGARQFWVEPFVVAAGTAVLAAGCLALAPSRGLPGVAMAMTLSSASMLILRGILVVRVLNELEEGARA